MENGEAAPPELASVPKYRIGAVSRLTGLSVDVVRAWERRYGVIHPYRTEGGARLYSEAEVARLRQLRQAVEQGHGISHVATLSEPELAELISRHSAQAVEMADPYVVARNSFLAAIERLDVVGADFELSRAAMLFPARLLVRDFIAPILHEVGQRWAHQELGIAHEHVASHLLRGLLWSLFRLYPPAASAHTMVLATPAGERHECGLLLVALLAATRGWRTVYLGVDLPAEEIARAVRLTKARLLALSVVNSSGGEKTEDYAKVEQELTAIADLIPLSTRVWIGGADAAEHRALIERADWVLVRDLDDLDDRLKQ